MLKIGGLLNIIIAVSHIIGLFWAEQMFEKTGAGEGMKELAQIHYSIPYLLTIFVSIIFFLFGIAFIYLFRGIGEQSYNLIKGNTTTSETIQSVIALIIGSLFLFGGLKKWKLKKE